jgi:L-fuconolactonase
MIDAHQHFWQLDRGDYDWITAEQGILFRDYLPRDLKPTLNKHGIDKTIVIQATPTIEETDYLLELYEQHEFIAGVVGWIDLNALSFGEDYHRLREHAGFVGIRPMLQDITDDRWILKPTVMKNVEKMFKDDFPMDMLIYPRHLPIIRELLQAFPKLKAVINHAAKPDIANGLIDNWRNDIYPIAQYENVYCKISGLITEADHQHWTLADISPYINELVQSFGPSKLMFGSDWPVCLQAGNYGDVYQVFQDSLSGQVSKEARFKMSDENAKKFYNLKCT